MGIEVSYAHPQRLAQTSSSRSLWSRRRGMAAGITCAAIELIEQRDATLGEALPSSHLVPLP
jgi:hypothetical protein